jgi:hypothetical protein
MSKATIPAPVQRFARQVSTTVGRLTAGRRLLPSFLIVGAQRCGTTSMYKTLTEHPGVVPAVLHKGVHYFDTSYHRGTDWYRGHFPTEASARRAVSDGDPLPITGEASPYYMFHPLAPERIGADLPGVRLVALLRDPVERAYSAHAHELARGFEDQPFERALDLEDERLAGEEERLRQDPTHLSAPHQHNAYLRRGHYAEQLERLATAVGRDRVHVIDSGDLFEQPGPVFEELCSFLGIASWQPAQFEQRNARPRSRLDAALQRRLSDYFAPHDERLAQWLGRTPSWRP